MRSLESLMDSFYLMAGINLEADDQLGAAIGPHAKVFG